MTKMRRLAMALLSAATAAVVTVASVVSAQALTSFQVSGDVSNDPTVVLNYSTYRPHSSYGSIVYLHQSGVNGVRFNLKSQSSGGTVGWSSYLNTGQQYEWTNVLAGNYAFQVQRGTSCFITCATTTFSGVYTS